MAHHKRRRPKNRRSGCLYCKPHKRNKAKDRDTPNAKRRTQDDVKALVEE